MTKKEILTILLISCTLVLAYKIALRYRQDIFGSSPVILRLKGKKTVNDVTSQIGETVCKRLLKDFDKKQAVYPPEKMKFLAFKQEKIIEVWVPQKDGEWVKVRVYPILCLSGGLGPKLAEGDFQVPEGMYRITGLNPNSAFHLSMKIGYPNEFDRKMGIKDKRLNLGKDIFVHGGEVSAGCLAVGDQAIEELFVIAAKAGIENTSITISPVDFRKFRLNEKLKLRYDPIWTTELYKAIKSDLNRFRE